MTYHQAAVVVGSFFFGEAVIVTAAYLAAKFNWPLFPLFAAAFAGTLVSDILWFMAGHMLFVRLQLWQRYEQRYHKIISAIERITGKRLFLCLLYIKFLYGTRILTLLYLSWRKLPFSQFLIYNSLGTALWLVVILSIGWVTGKGIINLIPAAATLQYVLLGVVVLFVISKLFAYWIHRRLRV